MLRGYCPLGLTLTRAVLGAPRYIRDATSRTLTSQLAQVMCDRDGVTKYVVNDYHHGDTAGHFDHHKATVSVQQRTLPTSVSSSIPDLSLLVFCGSFCTTPNTGQACTGAKSVASESNQINQSKTGCDSNNRKKSYGSKRRNPSCCQRKGNQLHRSVMQRDQMRH